MCVLLLRLLRGHSHTHTRARNPHTDRPHPPTSHTHCTTPTHPPTPPWRPQKLSDNLDLLKCLVPSVTEREQKADVYAKASGA